jgi:hypothetical protein
MVIDAEVLRLSDEPDVEDGSRIDIGEVHSQYRRRGGEVDGESIGHWLKVLIRNSQVGAGGEADHIDRSERCHDCHPSWAATSRPDPVEGTLRGIRRACQPRRFTQREERRSRHLQARGRG